MAPTDLISCVKVYETKNKNVAKSSEEQEDDEDEIDISRGEEQVEDSKEYVGTIDANMYIA